MQSTADKKHTKIFAVRILVFLALIMAWEGVSRAEFVNPRLFPPPSRVVVALTEWAQTGELFRDVGTSLWRVLLGFIIGGTIGTVTGTLTGCFSLFRRYLSPVIQVLRPLPPVAIIPLVIVWLGIGDTAKLFSISFGVFFPVWINTHVGASAVPLPYLRSARLLSRSRVRIAFRVVLPSTLPFIVAGLRISIALAFIMVYVAEVAGASSGIGYQISVSHLAYRIDKMMAALAVLAIAGAVFDGTFTRLVHVVFPWLKGMDST